MNTKLLIFFFGGLHARYETQSLKHGLSMVSIMALNFQCTCLTLQNNREDRPESPCLLRCLIPKEPLTLLFTLRAHLRASLMQPHTWVAPHKLPRIGNYEAAWTVCCTWKEMSEYSLAGICVPISPSISTLEFSRKKKDTLFSPTLIVSVVVVVLFLFNDCFGFFFFWDNSFMYSEQSSS